MLEKKIEGRRNKGRDRDRERMKIDRYIFFVSWYIASKEFNISREFDHKQLKVKIYEW